MSVPLWDPANDRVNLHLPRLSAVLNPLCPAQGLSALRLDQTSHASMQCLGVELPDADHYPAGSIEYYVRGEDLVATYAETPTFPLRAQIYWRSVGAQSGQVMAAVELIASVQTSLLESRPQLSTRTAMQIDQVLQMSANRDFEVISASALGAVSEVAPVGPHCFLFRLPGDALSYAEMIHPADAQGSQLHIADVDNRRTATLRHRLFAERLEKGVILRARVRGIWLDRRDDRESVARQYAEFLQAELPLTT